MKLSCDPHIPMQTHRVFIRQCVVQAWVGVYEHEQVRPTNLMFDIDIDVDGRLAATTDHIGDTVDYAAVVADLRTSLAQERHQLLETLSEFVANRILARFNACRVRVSVAKKDVLENVGSVGVEVERFQQVGVHAALPASGNVEAGFDSKR